MNIFHIFKNIIHFQAVLFKGVDDNKNYVNRLIFSFLIIIILHLWIFSIIY